MKAILVMDMPEKCDGCPLEIYRICMANSMSVFDDAVNGTKPDDCPLKELKKADEEHYPQGEYYDGYISGWNECIDSILEGSE